MKALIFSIVLSIIGLQPLELNTNPYERDTNRSYRKVLWQIASITLFQQEVKFKDSPEIAISKEIIALFFKNNFKEIIPSFNAKMKEAFTPEKMETVRKTLQAQMGAFKGTSRITEKVHEQYKIVEILCHFEKGDLTCRTTFDTETLVAGWYFVPVQ